MTKSNGIDPVAAKRWVGEIERQFDELASMRGEYMSRCKTVRERISDLKDAAAEAGIPRKALNTELKRRELEGKIESLIEELEEDDAETVEMLRTALGNFEDTPLGGAAVGAKAREQDAKASAAAKKGRSKKGDDPPATEASAKSDPLSSLVEDDKDVRPQRVIDAEKARIAENEERLKGGISEIKH